MKKIDRKLSIAPMMNWTNTHYRNLIRIITKNTLLYTEMVTAPALVHGDVKKHLKYNQDIEHPIAVQIGGSNLNDIAIATKNCQSYNYDEINLNVGCPSERVQNGKIGAILMKEPELVAQCLNIMADNTDKDISVKHRIGIDNDNEYSVVKKFVDVIASQSKCKIFIVHARVAILKGLSPKENRTIPPLKYNYVYQLKKDFPELEIILNGGINNIDSVKNNLNQNIDGVMIGRSAYNSPYEILSNVDESIFNSKNTIKSRKDILIEFIPYIKQQLDNNIYLSHIMQPTINLFNGQHKGKQYRRFLSENMHKKNAGISIVYDAIDILR